MARPRSTDTIKNKSLEAKDFAKLDLNLEPGIKNTLFVNENDRVYIGDPLAVGLPYDDAIDDLRIAASSITRNTGSFLFELDAKKEICIIKNGTNILFYQINTGGGPMTYLSSLGIVTLAENKEVYLEANFGSTEKAATTGYIKYVFLSLPREAWVVAYNTRNGDWQVERVASTYPNWAAASVRNLGDRRVPTVANGYYYEVTVAGTTASVQPTWPTTIGNTVVDGSVTWVCRGRYNNYPTTTSASARILNGYVFVCVGGDIYNSDLDLPDSWNTSDFISTEIYPDDVVALAKYKNYLVAFGTNTIEFFYDAANTSGTPLARQEGILHNIGCIGQGTVTDSEDVIYWISQTSSGTYSIWTLEKFEAKKVSTPEIDVFLTRRINEVAILNSEYLNYYYMFVTRINGSLILCIPLFKTDSPNPTYISSILAVDFEKQAFYEWELTSEGYDYIGKPVKFKSYYVYCTTTGTDIIFVVLGLPRYEPTLGGIPQDLILQSPSFETNPLDFGTNNYKVLNEISFNCFASIGTSSVFISRDRASEISYPTPVGVYKVTRLGRAREFRIKFQDTKILSKIECKYTEHSN